MISLYRYNISPYSEKVAAILRHKGLPYRERIVHPLRRRDLVRLSGQRQVPVLTDGERVVADSTEIARYLDETYPDKQIIPSDPAHRTRALLLEEWADEGLPRVVQPVRWFIPANAERTMVLWRSSYPAGLKDDLAFSLLGPAMRLRLLLRYGPMAELPSESSVLNRLAETLDLLDAALGETGWLCGPGPTVADFAVFGFLGFLEGLDGWETLKSRRRVARLVKELSTTRPVGDSDEAAMIEARQHRRATAESRATPENSAAAEGRDAAQTRRRLPLA